MLQQFKLIQHARPPQICLAQTQQLQVFNHSPENTYHISLDAQGANQLQDLQQGGDESTVLGDNQNLDFTCLVNVPVSSGVHHVLQKDVTQSDEKHTGHSLGEQSNKEIKHSIKEEQTQKQEVTDQLEVGGYAKVYNYNLICNNQFMFLC